MGGHKNKKEKVTVETVLLFGFAFLLADAFLAFTAFKSSLPAFGFLEALAMVVLVGTAIYDALPKSVRKGFHSI